MNLGLLDIVGDIITHRIVARILEVYEQHILRRLWNQDVPSQQVVVGKY